MSPSKIDRRRFLKHSAWLTGAATLPGWIAPATAIRGGEASPNHQIRLGCIGLGTQGTGNMKAFLGHPEVRVIAVCDVHATQRQLGKAAVDNFYSNHDCAEYRDFRELIARPDIDQLGRKLRWDPVKEDFVGDAEASAMLDRPMRPPWRLS